MITNSSADVYSDVIASIGAHEPEQIALVQNGRSLNYEELNGQANQIAHYLLSQGAGPESKIGVSIPRSIEFAAAALGILKSGAAYVPLDPSYPEARRLHIAEDAGLKLILAAGHGSADTSHWPMPVVSIDSVPVLSQPDSDPGLPSPGPSQLAYVIYTSGSTGTAKGVEVTHANLRHLIDWHLSAFQVTSADRATLVANVGFDASVWELWPYLAAGATLLIPSSEIVRDPEAVRDWIVAEEVSIMFAPTLLAEVLFHLDWPANTSLRFLLTGGDTLHTSPPSGLPFRVVNNYGPAECTVVSTSCEVAPGDANQKIPSIGRAVAGAKIALLDEELREVPAGSAGEICIAGNGVARGYLNRPELTAERFIVLGDQRYYRSGDLGSLNSDGTIQFLGRMDEQVKIRGYRIECGEIEAALNRLPMVETSAVVLREQRGGHKGLTAYLVPSPGAELSRDELREGLRSLLPEYMLPEQFVRIGQMPVSDNGKIDRRNLPPITGEMIVRSTESPASAVETELMGILAKLLKVDQIERSDDFFLLGGHSFAAAQLIALVRSHFGVELSLRAVFENPTPRDMAQQIEQRIAAKA